MRIGTWNLDARWSEAHRALLADARCDLWLLTEVNPKAMDSSATIAGYHCHLTTGVMARGQHWAAVLSRVPLSPLPDPHDASAAALVDGVTYCATILPWAGCTNPPPTPWVGATLEDMARPAIEGITKACPRSNTVWGGDWNQNLAGGWQSVGSAGMRRLVESAVSLLDLQVATAELPSQSGASQNTIDHLAVPLHWRVRSAARVSAAGLSDHDAYVVEVDVG
jgi:hypothetical protein